MTCLDAREAAGSPTQSHQTVYKKAFDLTVSPLRTIFEVQNEPAKVIDAYGGRGNQFGLGCLLARVLRRLLVAHGGTSLLAAAVRAVTPCAAHRNHTSVPWHVAPAPRPSRASTHTSAVHGAGVTARFQPRHSRI